MGQSSPTSLKGKSAVADRSSYVHFQTVLDDGNVYNWFDSPFIVKLSAVAALALVGFVLWQFLTPTPLVNLRLLGRRNFGLGTLGNFLLGFALYGSAYLLPPISLGRTRLRRRADRRSHGLDRAAAAFGDPAGAVVDETDGCSSGSASLSSRQAVL
jgi:hypothetical protein